MSYTFDGPNKLIILSSGVTYVSLYEMYSRWKEWLMLSDNSKYLQALSYIGADPIPGGQLGTTFFIENGWKIRPYEGNHTLTVAGNLYSRDGSDPFVSTVGSWNVRIVSVVSTLVETVVQNGVGTPQDVAEAVWNAQSGNYTTTGSTGQKLIAAGNSGDPLSADPSLYPVGTAGYKIAHIEDDVRTELSTELNRIDTSISSRLPSSNYVAPPSVNDIWSADINTDYGTNSIGNWMRTKLLTVAKFIGLK